MNKIRIGVIAPANIALNRFMPALLQLKDDIEYVGISSYSETERFGCISNKNNLEILNNNHKKCLDFISKFGGKYFLSFNDMLKSSEIDAVYIPLPPNLHFKWAKLALENNKHVILEKPFTDSYFDSCKLIDLAKEKNLAIHENYMFMYHSQIEYVKKIIQSGELGEIRLISINFGFPFRGNDDFRYKKELGGGSLLDCGGYTIKLASYLLGDTTKLVYHKLNYLNNFNTDIYGYGCFENDEGLNAITSFGMDNCYRCDLEIWGSKKTIKTNRIFTCPKDVKPVFYFNDSKNNNYSVELEYDDSFKNSIKYFVDLIRKMNIRNGYYDKILKQAKFVEKFKEE